MHYKEDGVKSVLYALLFAVMAFQILLSLVWISRNFAVIPSFGDTIEYVELSKTLIIDEYRPILYPLFLKLVIKLEGIISIPYQCIVYVCQYMTTVAAMFYMVKSMIKMAIERLDIKLNQKSCIFYSIWFTAYFVSIPMITFMNFAVLADSFALSFLIIMLTELTCVAISKNWSYYNGLIN